MQRRTSVAVVLISLLPVISSQAQLQTPSKDSADIDVVKQIEVDLGNFAISGEFDKLGQLYADDFAAVGSSGAAYTKKDVLSGESTNKLLWFEVGSMDVQVFGNIALGKGFVREKRLRNGKETNPDIAWMDILQKRAGRWLVVRSATSTIAKAEWPITHQDPALVQSIKKLEQEVGDAMVAVDIEKLNQSYADDWADLGLSSAKVFTKESLLSEFKTGAHKLVSFELGPMNVQVLDDVAVVQASVNEKRIQDGKDTSGKFVFMDLLKKRADKWVIVRSLGAKVS